jgi:hypothetical protein
VKPWRIPGIGTLPSDAQGVDLVDGKGDDAGLVMVALRQATNGAL